MPGLVLPNGSEIEIYGAGSAVPSINDRVVYSKETVRVFISDVRGEEGIVESVIEKDKDGRQHHRNGSTITVGEYLRKDSV